MLELYKNKEWLYKQYWGEELSTRKIGKLCEVSQQMILYQMQKFSISTRSVSKGIHLAIKNNCNLSLQAIDWINGELLGDGCLNIPSIYSASFSYNSKYKSYIEYVSNTLNSFGIKQAGKINKRYNKVYNNLSFHYASLSYVELLPIYKQWYPNNKKIIPRNLILTPLTLCQHYIGDGHLYYCKWGRPQIVLCTDSFSILDVEWFKEQLKNLGFKVTRMPKANRIHISAYSVQNFLKYIGKCPEKSYLYKWDYDSKIGKEYKHKYNLGGYNVETI